MSENRNNSTVKAKNEQVQRTRVLVPVIHEHICQARELAAQLYRVAYQAREEAQKADQMVRDFERILDDPEPAESPAPHKTMTMIRAEVYADQYNLTLRFDAAPWFIKASDEEIIELAGCYWGGNESASRVARAVSQHDRGVKKFFTLLEAKDDRRFECHVDAEDALTWIRANRPHLQLENSHAPTDRQVPC